MNLICWCLFVIIIATCCMPIKTSDEIVRKREINATLICKKLGIANDLWWFQTGSSESKRIFNVCIKDIIELLKLSLLDIVNKIVDYYGKSDTNNAKIKAVKDVRAISEKFKKENWSLEMVTPVVKHFNTILTGRVEFVDKVMKYSTTAWWKEFFASSFLVTFFNDLENVDQELLDHARYKLTLFYYKEKKISCKKKILLAILDFDNKRTFPLQKENFFSMFDSLCSGNWPEDAIQSVLNNSLLKNANLDATLFLFKYGKELIMEVHSNFLNVSDWSYGFICLEVHQCVLGNDLEKCIQWTVRAIKGAISIYLKPNMFTSSMDAIQNLHYNKVEAHKFMVACSSSSKFFSLTEKSANVENISKLMKILFILNFNYKEKARIQKDKSEPKESKTITKIKETSVDESTKDKEKLSKDNKSNVRKTEEDHSQQDLAPGLVAFLSKAKSCTWTVVDQINFLEKSWSNRVDVEDFQNMFDLINSTIVGKNLEIQDMFSKLQLMTINNKIIWTFLKEKNLKLDLIDFVRVLDTADVNTFPAIINFFLNENITNCKPNTVLEVAYYSKLYNYSLSELQYKKLFDESCLPNQSEERKTQDVITKARNENWKYNELVEELQKVNGKALNNSQVQSENTQPGKIQGGK